MWFVFLFCVQTLSFYNNNNNSKDNKDDRSRNDDNYDVKEA